MFYFDTLPKVITPDNAGNNIILTNLLSRANIIESLKDDSLAFYEYYVQDGDTPEIVAEKYYGDSYAYWIVLYCNSMLDPLWDWPMTSNHFEAYINKKYESQATAENTTPFVYASSFIHSYQKIIETTESYSGKVTTEYLPIDETTYNALGYSTNTYNIDGNTCTVKISKRAISYYDYEYELNESKRSIKLINSQFFGQITSQFEQLMGA